MASRRAILLVYLILFVLAAALAAFSFVLWYSADRLRGRLIATLADRFDSEVELGDLHVRAFPTLHVDGSNLILRHHGRRERWIRTRQSGPWSSTTWNRPVRGW